MTAADEIRDHQARCQPYLLRLHMLARGEDGLTATAVEVGCAADAIIAEAEAASRVALAASEDSRRHPGTRTLLQVRLNRLAAAAAEAMAAARDGDPAGLRRHLCRFEAVTSAIWTVQHAVCGPAASPRLASGRPAIGAPSAGIRLSRRTAFVLLMVFR